MNDRNGPERPKWSKMAKEAQMAQKTQMTQKGPQCRAASSIAKGSHQLKKRRNFVNKIHKTLTPPGGPTFMNSYFFSLDQSARML